jgi:hypothetical protein
VDDFFGIKWALPVRLPLAADRPAFDTRHVRVYRNFAADWTGYDHFQIRRHRVLSWRS